MSFGSHHHFHLGTVAVAVVIVIAVVIVVVVVGGVVCNIPNFESFVLACCVEEKKKISITFFFSSLFLVPVTSTPGFLLPNNKAPIASAWPAHVPTHLY